MHLNIWKRWPVITLSILIAVSIAVVGSLFFLRARDIMQTQLRQRLENTAASAALFIDGDALDGIRGPKDKKKESFVDIVERLKSMRSMRDVRFAYIMRKTEDPNVLMFVADADSLSSEKDLDVNENGIVDPDEEPSNPGDLYDISGTPAMQGPAFEGPASDTEIVYDRWGPLISGYAPIRRSDGSVAGIIGIDMKAEQYTLLSESAFTPLALMFVVLMGIVIAGTIVVLWERRQIAILNKVNAERSGLLKLTFHQLGEPLTIMKWSLETLREEAQSPELKKLVDEHVVCMDEGLGRLNSIIDTLQQAEKVDLNTLKYIPLESSVKHLIENAVGEWQSSIEKRKQIVKIEMPDDLKFPFDHNMIMLVMRQLLQNSIEYSPEGSTITIRVVEGKQKVTISIADEGFGIPKEDMEHLFEKYRRASNAPLHKPDGNGLGLYIAKGIVLKAGGKIWVQSIVDKGTTVSFTLPLVP